jgi:hypothetical protein
MVGDPETTLDHDADPGRGPAFGIEAGRRGPSGEDIEEILPLPRRQPRGASRPGASFQRRRPVGAVSQPLGPLAYGRTADDQLARDLGLG